MLKRYAARQAQREERERAATEQWHRLRAHFAMRLTEAAGSICDLVRLYEFPAPEEADWHLWWERANLEQQADIVRQCLQKRYLTHVALHGGRFAGPAEWQSVSLIEYAEKKGVDALIAALFVTAARSADREHNFRPSLDAEEALNSALDQAHRQLKGLQISAYTTARSWFLPERFTLRGAPETAEDVVGILAGEMGDFLARWVPVRVTTKIV